MLLNELVEALVTHLNDNKASWTEDDITVTAEMDVMPQDVDTLSVYVVPEVVQPIIEGVKSRGNRHVNNELLVCSLLLAQKFTEVPAAATKGVANWSTEVAPLIATWQRAQEVALRYESADLTLDSVEPQPPQALELDNRVYAVMTTLTYNQVVCDTAHELVSPSIASSGGTALQRIRASIKSQH